MSARAVVLVLVACSAGPRPRMYPAGTDKDDGYGDLAQKSARLLINDKADPSLFAAHRRRHGDPYGGAMYGGEMYGGAGDAAPDDDARARGGSRPRYHAVAGLTGTIEGTVTWRGAPPPRLTTPCGSVDSLRLGPSRAIAGILVYIEGVDLGRPIPTHGRPVPVGGLIAKRGCALAPALQIITPLPAGLAIHGDASEVRLRVTHAAGSQPITLQPGGRILLSAQPGLTRIEADDGSLGAAWVIALDTPYYAITDDRGHFRIPELATGTYDLTFSRPSLATTTDGKLVYGPPVTIHRSVKVDAAHPAHLDVALDDRAAR